MNHSVIHAVPKKHGQISLNAEHNGAGDTKTAMLINVNLRPDDEEPDGNVSPESGMYYYGLLRYTYLMIKYNVHV